ncbi:MAG: hypothetical protein ABSF90_23160 [Syntrophobacteraceae bacterium]|jgi:hypothetical protein
MFPWQKKINDANLLQLIPGWKQPSRGSAEPLGVRGTVPRSFVLLSVCGDRFGAQSGYDGSKPKIPTMFPGCFHGTEKD